ncbi:MAG: lycopene cyclase domain-containing protein [Anaerolineae bacterium]|nr:lycopene cyclase domain-containing protein [Anaerolineae bacterium]
MTYFGFLGLFVVVPMLILWLIALIDHRRGVRLPAPMQTWDAWVPILTHCVIAVVYTTPWDNYLVATKVWWYDPKLVTGLVLGYVPIEEYCFFVLQVLLTGAWLAMLARHTPITQPVEPSPRKRWMWTLALLIVWLGFLVILIGNWRPGTYLALLMLWALPPVMMQTAFGADILWRHRKIILLSIIPMTLYLAASDKLAISSGTWTINPEQTVGILILGRLPIEEFAFFLMTNTLITLGCTLMLDVESKARAIRYVTMARQFLAARGRDRVA